MICTPFPSKSKKSGNLRVFPTHRSLPIQLETPLSCRKQSHYQNAAAQCEEKQRWNQDGMLNLPVLQLTLQASQVRVRTSKRDSVHDLQGRGPILGTMQIPSAFFHQLLNRQSYGCLCTTLIAVKMTWTDIGLGQGHPCLSHYDSPCLTLQNYHCFQRLQPKVRVSYRILTH